MSKKELLNAAKFCLVTFPTTHNALHAEKVLEESGLIFLIMPTPREISAGCGLAIRFFHENLSEISSIIKDKGITVKEYYHVDKDADGNKVSLMCP